MKSLNRGIIIDRCCDCGFNEHGQDRPIPWQYTYLGITIKSEWGTSLGGPMLYCMYDPKKDFRDNMRGVTHGFGRPKLVIWIAGDDRFKGEMDNQLHGFPKRCPLKEINDE